MKSSYKYISVCLFCIILKSICPISANAAISLEDAMSAFKEAYHPVEMRPDGNYGLSNRSTSPVHIVPKWENAAFEGDKVLVPFLGERLVKVRHQCSNDAKVADQKLVIEKQNGSFALYIETRVPDESVRQDKGFTGVVLKTDINSLMEKELVCYKRGRVNVDEKGLDEKVYAGARLVFGRRSGGRYLQRYNPVSGKTSSQPVFVTAPEISSQARVSGNDLLGIKDSASSSEVEKYYLAEIQQFLKPYHFYGEKNPSFEAPIAQNF